MHLHPGGEENTSSKIRRNIVLGGEILIQTGMAPLDMFHLDTLYILKTCQIQVSGVYDLNSLI